jgi:S1-C subfamily serine protease
MPPHGGSSSILTRGAFVALLAVVVGLVLGHFVWGAPSSVQLSPASSRALGPFGFTAPGGREGSGPYGGSNGPGNGLFAPGGGAAESGGSGESGGAGEGGAAEGGGASGAASGVSSSITSKVDPALVDINTDLGYQGGEAAGTGMVVTSTGEVITNNHVITGATKITATDIGNGTTYAARVVGYDYGQDIAVLQLEGASGLKTVSLGDSASLQAGQSIATIGNAGGVGGTPSAAGGRVSALDQSVTAGDEVDGGQEHLSGLIELEGDLQPGDSGGPLVNSAGEVVGMDTAASTTFQFESSADQAFAIPISEVQPIANEIVHGQASSTLHLGATGFLGLSLQSQNGEGALVENVLSGTPAASSGLTAGDVIKAVDGSSISSPTALTEFMLQQHPGDSVRVSWETQEGAQQSATITLASGPPQ